MKYSHSFCASNSFSFISQMDDLIKGGVTDIHLDFMDYQYTRSFGLNLDIVKELKDRYPNITFNAHIMAEEPFNLAEDLLNIGITKLGFHLDTITFEGVKAFKESHPKAIIGCAVIADDNIEANKEIIKMSEFAVLMTINKIGGTGQPFNPELLKRVKELRNINPNIEVISDGGLRKENAKQFADADVDYAVGGSIINNVEDKTQFNTWFQEIIKG